ncbi:MAG TPA: DUF1801 domain-containing protein [Candidatus Saccharimonadia bacterium]|nr:DUF1801 domain-containing protein [Candidatus Saccharimonadia bacterium]
MNLHTPNTPEVDAFMAELSHPLKAEVQALREIMKGISPGITEQIKWAAPSFSYKDDYVMTMNLRNPKDLMLVWHHPRTREVKSDILVDPKPDGRAFSHFANMSELEASRGEIERVVKELIAS